jgi:hypothetical protein
MEGHRDQSGACLTSLKTMVPQKARLAYLTSQAGEVVLNVQTESMYMRFELNRDQLAGIVLEGVKVLLQ